LIVEDVQGAADGPLGVAEDDIVLDEVVLVVAQDEEIDTEVDLGLRDFEEVHVTFVSYELVLLVVLLLFLWNVELFNLRISYELVLLVFLLLFLWNVELFNLSAARVHDNTLFRFFGELEMDLA